MVVGEIAEAVDLLVVGGGAGGYVAALRAAQLGREVVVVERRAEGLGGCCLHVGCIPSKALIELASTKAHAEGMAAAGLSVGETSVDLGRFQEWKGGIVRRLSNGVATLFEKRGIRQVEGELRFNKADRAAVRLPDGNVAFYEFQQAIVATGSRPTALPSLAPDGERVLDSTGALALDRLPATVAVVGAGYIGLEIGTALAKLGCRVSVIEALDRVLPTVDVALTRPVVRSLKRLGVELHLSSLAVGLDGPDLVVENSAGERRVPAEKVIVAVGRTPNTDDLGLDRAGVSVGEDRLVPVDAQRLATPRVAAIGDVTAGPALAHKASAEGIVAAEALSGHAAAFDPAAIPAVIFTDPEVASTGLSQAEAEALEMEVAVGSFPFAASGRAATLGAREGFAQVVVDRATDRVVGVHVVGPHASELIAEGTLAVEMMASPEDVAGTIHAHPTLSESLAEAVELLLGRPVHVAA